MTRFLIFVLLVAPALGDAVECMSARACATAPCCVTKGASCPMHQSQGKCSLGGCKHEVTVAQLPPAVRAVALTFVRREARGSAMPHAVVAFAAHVNAPPDPPPPRANASFA